jgi:hypothetical protein
VNLQYYLSARLDLALIRGEKFRVKVAGKPTLDAPTLAGVYAIAVAVVSEEDSAVTFVFDRGEEPLGFLLGKEGVGGEGKGR